MVCPRRLASLALVVALGALSLTGCRSAPTAAVYVDGKQFSNEYVEQLNGEIIDAIQQLSPQAQGQDVPYGALRQLIVSSLVVKTVGQHLAAERNRTIPAADPATGVYQVLGVEQGNPLGTALIKTRVAQVLADAFVTMSVLSEDINLVDPTEAEQREVYNTIMGTGQVPSQPFEEVKEFFTKEALGPALALRNLLAKEFDRADVVANPRYAPLAHRVPMQVGGVGTYVLAPISTR